MKAFNNDPAIKQMYLDRVRAHRAADEIVKGVYWEDGKGCFIGCTIHSYDQSLYEQELGIPEWLARIGNYIFEGLTNERAKDWPEQFLLSASPGADLDTIKKPFIEFVFQSLKDWCEQTGKVLDLIEAPNEEQLSAFKEDVESFNSSVAIVSSGVIQAAFGVDVAESEEDYIATSYAYAYNVYNAYDAYEKYANKLLELIAECPPT